MADWDLYARKLNISGSTTKDRHVNSTIQSILKNFELSPSCKDVYFNDEIEITKVTIVEDGTNSDVANDVKTFVLKPNEKRNVGDIVNWDNEKWLIVNTEMFDIVYQRGHIQKTNNTLKFYSNETQLLWTLKQTPCIVGKGSISLDENKFLSLPADEYIIVCPNNSDSQQISVDTRFILSGSAYSVQGIDNISSPGLLNIRVKEVAIDTVDDNLELGIANYYSHQNVYTLQLNSSPTVNLNYMNQTAIIDITCFTNGIEDISPILSITNDNPYVCSVDTNTLTITATGTGTANITIDYHGSTIQLVVNGVMSTSDNYSLSINGSDFIKIGQQSTFTALLTNNGVSEMRNVVWSLFADDEISSTNLASIVSTSGTYGENVVLKANSNMLYGNVKLKCITDNSLYSTIKTISIKSLL